MAAKKKPVAKKPVAKKPPPSTKPVLAKLGLKPDYEGIVIDRPVDIGLGALAGGASLSTSGSGDWVLAFVRDAAAIEKRWPAVKKAAKPGAVVWLAYPKKTGAIATDIDRDHGWQPLLADDWHPVMQVAIDATWSALRFRPRAEIKQMTRKF